MTLSIKNGRYAFLIRLDLMFFMSYWKEFQLWQILNDQSIRHLIKLILHENDVKLLKFKGGPVSVGLWYVWGVRFWLLIPEMNTSRKTMKWNEIEYDKLYPSGSASARIYGTPKMHKFSSSDSFPKLCPIFSSIGTFN